MSDTYYTVGVHGAPTPETAPHGFAWIGVADHRWRFASAGHDVHANSTKWYPLPPPPTEQAPPPEPEPLWTRGPGITILRRVGEGHKKYGVDDADYLVDIANALDRDGVAWGPGRPMSELPGDPAGTRSVLVLYGDTGLLDVRKAQPIYADRDNPNRVCWWPLPLPGEATT